MGLEMRQLDSVQKAPLVSEEGGGRKKRPHSQARTVTSSGQKKEKMLTMFRKLECSFIRNTTFSEFKFCDFFAIYYQ